MEDFWNDRRVEVGVFRELIIGFSAAGLFTLGADIIARVVLYEGRKRCDSSEWDRFLSIFEDWIQTVSDEHVREKHLVFLKTAKALRETEERRER